jgi:hypothetical protein
VTFKDFLTLVSAASLVAIAVVVCLAYAHGQL